MMYYGCITIFMYKLNSGLIFNDLLIDFIFLWRDAIILRSRGYKNQRSVVILQSVAMFSMTTSFVHKYLLFVEIMKLLMEKHPSRNVYS